MCENTTSAGRSVYTKFRVFPNFHECWHKCISIRKKYFIFLLSYSTKNTKVPEWMSDGKFSVFTSSYVNTPLNQSAFRIHKCHIIHKIIDWKHGQIKTWRARNLNNPRRSHIFCIDKMNCKFCLNIVTKNRRFLIRKLKISLENNPIKLREALVLTGP